MLGFIIKRMVFAILTIWFVVTLTFILMHYLPGDPFTTNKPQNPQILSNLKERYGLDKPLYIQYGVYMVNLLKLDMGTSMVHTNRSVNSIISRTFIVSADLGVRAVGIALFVGLLLGTVGALYQHKFVNTLIRTQAVVFISVPGFIFAALLQYFLCYQFSAFIQSITGSDTRLLPILGWGSFKHTVVPSIALALGPLGMIIRLFKTSIAETMDENFITAARAKGLTPKSIIVKHVLRNSILPVASIMGPLITSILLGSFIVENIFAIPGLGQYYITSVQDKDYTMVMGLSIFVAFITIIANTVFDLLYAWIDPRVRASGAI